MQASEIINVLECNPVIAAIQDDKWDRALNSAAQVILHPSANILTVKEKIQQAHECGKYIIVHLDLAEGIGKDWAAILFLAQCGVDGIISTKVQLIRLAKAQGLLAIQRFFALDSKGIESIDEMLHGTAVIVLAGLTNALKVVGKKKENVKIVTVGAGAAGIAIVKMLLSAGFTNITMYDKQGALYVGCPGMNWAQAEMAARTNPDQTPGTLAEKLVGADVFIGTSAPGLVATEMVSTMNRDTIIFACANPTPEIFLDAARRTGVVRK